MVISNEEEEEKAKPSGPTVPRQPVSMYIHRCNLDGPSKRRAGVVGCWTFLHQVMYGRMHDDLSFDEPKWTDDGPGAETISVDCGGGAVGVRRAAWG